MLAYLTHLAYLISSRLRDRLRELPAALQSSMKQQKGFTLAELIITVVALGSLLLLLALVIVLVLAGLKYLEVF